MSLIGLVHLAEGVFKQTQENQNGATANGNAQAQSTAQKTGTIDHDEFRHSNANVGNEAGLFQVKQASVFSAAATVLLVQGGEGENQQNAQTQAGQTANNGQAVATNVNANAPSASTPATAAAATTANTEDAQALSQLANLNAALIALGLSQDEINVVDRVAQLINNFSPAAFTSLVNQLQVLAQENGQSTSGTAANTAATPNTNIPANAAAGTAANGATATAQNSGFTIQSLTIKFAGVKEIVQQRGRGSSANNSELISAFSLQVSEAQITLGNPATGQSAQVQVPQATAPTTTATPATAKAATA